MDACCNKRRQAHLSSSSSLLWRTELRMLSELFCTDRLISDPGWRQGGRRYDSLTPLWKKHKKHLNSKNIPPIMMAKKEKVPHRSWWLHPLCVPLLPIVCATDGSRNQNRKSLQEKKKTSCQVFILIQNSRFLSRLSLVYRHALEHFWNLIGETFITDTI